MIGSNIVESSDGGASHDTLSQLIDLAASPTEAKKRISDLKKAETNAKKALLELKIGTNLAKGLEDLEAKRVEALDIIENAQNKAAEIVEEAGARVRDINDATRQSSDNVA